MRRGLASSLPAAPNPAGRSRIHAGRPKTPALGVTPEGDIGAGGVNPGGTSRAVPSTRPNCWRQIHPEHPLHPPATASARTRPARNEGDFANICQRGDFPSPCRFAGRNYKIFCEE